jgi:hypothetical protein
MSKILTRSGLKSPDKASINSPAVIAAPNAPSATIRLILSYKLVSLLNPVYPLLTIKKKAA